ncbi:MAG: sulfatase [Planctomycetota bacterium]
MSPRAPTSTPGLLAIVADDWSPIAGCYGHPQIHTPHIDALAAQGTVFRNAFCTTPSCAASRANLLTGLYSHTHGQYGHCHGPHGFRTHEHVESLPAVLRRAGVFSGLIGKHHVAPAHVYPFDASDESDPWRHAPLLEAAARFLRQAAGMPFFLQVASYYPHRVGAGFDPAIGGPEMLRDDVAYDPHTLKLPASLPDTPETRVDFADYCRFITRFDRLVGGVLAVLQESGRTEDTLVLVLTDHGMPFPGAKGSWTDAGHRCPLIARHPEQGRAAHCDALLSWSQFAPTCYDWFGAKAEHALPERSVLALLENPTAQGNGRVYFSHCFHEVTNYQPYRAVRTRRFKYVRDLAWQLPFEGVMPSDLFDSATWRSARGLGATHARSDALASLSRRGPEAFYDLDEDPCETNNRVGDPAYAEPLQALKARLRAFRERTGDPWLQWDHQTGA